MDNAKRVSRKLFLAGLTAAVALAGISAGIGHSGGLRARSLRRSAHSGAQHRRSLAQRIFGDLSPSPQPVIAPFLGNLTALFVPSADGVALQRQPDCSLTFSNYTYTFTSILFTSMLNSQTPGYERILHNNAFLNTTPGVFAKGCVDSTLGGTSRNIIYMGKGNSGQEMIAVGGSDNVLTFGLKSDGTLTQADSQTTDFPPFSLVSGDLNKDGNPDLISINTSALQSSITVFLGNSDGSFKPGTSLPLPGAVAEFGILDDLDGDGNLDLLVGSGSPGFQFSIFLGKGDGTFQAAQTFTPPANTVFFSDLFITADVNGDGAKDIITSHGAVFLGKGDGVTFTLAPQPAFPPIVAASNEYAPGIVAADFNKDGHLDLVTNDGATIRTYFGKGDGTFTAGPAYATIVNRGFLIATDLDGDGNIDLVSGFTASGLYSGDDFTPNLAYALMGNGDGSFQGASALPISYSGSNLADLNDDGHADLVGLAPTPETLTFVTQLAQSNGGFKPGPSLVPPVNDGADSWALGDLNGDGKADLIYLNISQNTPGFYVALGNGDGSFQTPIFTAAPSLVGPGAIDINQILSGIRIADFNHDGKLDIIYSFSDQSNITQLFLQGFAVQLGHGDGTFAAPAITTTYSSLVAPLFAFSNMLSGVADVNGDNFPDVFMVLPTVITNGTAQHETQLFVGKGDGTFKPPNTLTLTGNIKASNAPGDGSPFVVADLNGDGKADLVATGSDTTGSTPTVAIALGNGDGTFQAPTLLTLEGFGYASGPAIADFDGDGKLDLFVNVVVEAAGQGIFPGNGNGTFQTITNPDGTVSAPDAIVLSAFGGAVATDLNDDGKPDLIVGNVVLLNKNGSVVPPSASTATAVTSSLNPSSTGASVTFTATVTSATAGAITGTATFFDGATSIGTGTVGAGGLATLLTSTLAAGSHSITARYGGDANFAASTSPALTQVVNVGGTAATATTVASSLNPSTVGQSVTFTATSTSATAGTLTGTISFFDGATQIGNPVTIAAGMSTVSSATLPQGTHSITAKYSGDAKFSTSTSPALSQVVNAAALVSTTTTLTGPATATAGASVSFMASVTPASGTKVPTGTVMFLDGATNLGPGTLNGSGSTTFSTSTLSTGTHSITAQYGGDANFATSTSTAASINITAATGNFTLSVSPSSVTVTASQPGMAVVTLTPTNGFNQQVQFSCSNVPEGIDCEFEPHSVTPNGGPVTTMLAVTQETEGNARRRKSTATGNWFDRRGSNTPAPAMKTVFVPVLGCEMLLLAGLWRRRKSANQRGALQFAFTVMLLVTIATFVGGCSNMPNSHNTAATITIIGTGPGNQTAMVPLTINLQK